MFYRWRRLDSEGRRRVWLLFAWYSGLMVCGSCFGAATWVARMIAVMNSLKGDDAKLNRNLVEAYALVSVSYSWRAAFNVTYAVEFLCLSAAKLMVLDRMSRFAAPRGSVLRKWWVGGGRIVMAIVVLGNAAGLAANIAGAVHLQKSSEFASAASFYFTANMTKVALQRLQSSRDSYQFADSILSVQSSCEVVVLLVIVAAFIVGGVLCTRHFRFALGVLDSAGADMASGMMLRRSTVDLAKSLGRQMRKEVVATAALVFVAFVLRSVVSTMLAVARQYQDSANVCPGVDSICDASCTNEFTHLLQWNAYTPEFRPMVALISSPLTLLVALWGITSKFTLQSKQRSTVHLKPRAS
jgi:hypothetical protein